MDHYLTTLVVACGFALVVLIVALAAVWLLAGYDHRCPDCEMPRDLCECDG